MDTKQTLCNLSLRLDLNDSTASLEKLKFWNPQNFTSILNKPNNSLMDDIINKFYDNQNTITSTTEHDISRFTDVGSPRSMHSTKSNKTFKQLINENFTDYLSKIKPHYSMFKANHFKKSDKNNITTTSSIINVTTDTIQNAAVGIYNIRDKIYKLIPQEFFTENFRIKKEHLCLGRFEIESLNRDLIEKSGEIEYEIEKILDHSNKLYNYIQNNHFLESKVGNIVENISNIKKTKTLLKNKFMVNGLKCVKTGYVKNDLEKKKDIIIKIKSIHEIIKLLEVLSGNQSKYELVNELIIKARKIIETFPSQIKNRAKICRKLEEELDKFNSKSCENMIEELQKNITDFLSDSIEILSFPNISLERKEISKIFNKFKKDPNTIENFQDIIKSEEHLENFTRMISYIRSFNFDLSFISEYQLVLLISALKTIEFVFNSKNIDKIQKILLTLIANNWNFYRDFGGLFNKAYLELIGHVKTSLFELFYNRNHLDTIFSGQVENEANVVKDENTLIQEEISMDILLMLCLNNILDIIKKNISWLQKKLTSIIEENINIKDLNKPFNKELFSKQFYEMSKNIESENTKILHNLLNKTLKYFNSIDDLDVYLISYLNFKEVLKKFNNESLDYKNLMKKQFFEFISPLLEEKFKLINEALENENWSAAFTESSDKNNQNLLKLQTKIDILFYMDFNNYKSLINVNVLSKIISAQKDIGLINFFISPNVNEPDNKSINNNGEASLDNITSVKTNETIKQDNKGENSSNNQENKNNPQNLEVKNTVEFKDGKFKIMNSTITLINCIFETYKMLLVCEDSLMPHICDSICSQIRKFLEYHREMVLDGEGVRKGKLKAIYQKEISIVCSNALIIKRFIGLFASNQLLSPIFVELRVSIEDILNTCRIKINELFLLIVTGTIEELTKYELKNYPIQSNDVNMFVKKLRSFLSLYKAMQNCFENEDIVKTLNDNFKILFDKIENYFLASGAPKPEDENIFKQIKKDLITVKKMFKDYSEVIDTNEIMNRIDNINKNTLPKSLLRKKKTDDKDN